MWTTPGGNGKASYIDSGPLRVKPTLRISVARFLRSLAVIVNYLTLQHRGIKLLILDGAPE